MRDAKYHFCLLRGVDLFSVRRGIAHCILCLQGFRTDFSKIQNPTYSRLICDFDIEHFPFGRYK
jgi:hypothetical protein